MQPGQRRLWRQPWPKLGIAARDIDPFKTSRTLS